MGLNRVNPRLLMALIMAGPWICRRRMRNAGCANVCRTLGAGVHALAYVLLGVGIRAVALRGEACQRTTNAFYPGPPRPDPEASR